MKPSQMGIFLSCLCFATALGCTGTAFAQASGPATIDVNAGATVGAVSKYIFGQNLEHEHGAVSGGEQNKNHEHGLHSGGLWAEMLRDRKFEEGDVDRDGVANGWVPEERITNRYDELVNGRGRFDRYRIDENEYYGGGAAQAVEVYGDGSNHASIYQIGLRFVKGRRYVFYTYLKRRGTGFAWVEFDAAGKSYGRHEFQDLSPEWTKYTAEFTAPEDTQEGRVRIAVQGGGVFWIDSASLMPADNVNGIRADVLEAVKPLKVPILRYPGGCFADSYHWQDGIGNRDRRPERWSPFWNEWEANDFGTDEFMEFVRATDMEPHMTANSLTGTPEEAALWVEYANGSTQTPMGQLRARNGHPDPYGIKLWAFGNEVQEMCSGEYIGRNDVHRYAQRFEEFRKAIRQTDPSVHLMAVGAGPGPLEWNHALLKLVPDPDYLGFSIYTGEGERVDDYDTKIMDLNHFYRHVVAEPADFKRELNAVIQSIGDLLPQRPLLAVTEFQSWWLTEKADADLRLADALYIAGVYNELLRHARQVSIAEIESLINVQGIIESSQTSLKLTPEYFACMLYRHHTGGTVLETSTESPITEFNAQLPMLDAVATLSADGRTLYLAVVNRAEAKDVNTSIRIRGWTAEKRSARIFEISSSDKVAANQFGSPTNVNIREKAGPLAGQTLSCTFRAHSVTVVEVAGNR